MAGKRVAPKSKATVERTPRPLGPYVPGYGNDSADVMFIGEAPGREEELRRRPFVGKTGMELKKLCDVNGIDLRDCYLTNVVKHRPSTGARKGNAAPSKEDIARDTPELVAEIEYVRPMVVVAVGLFATRWVLGDPAITMDESHGFAIGAANWRMAAEVSGGAADLDPERLIAVHHFTVVPVYHPAAGFHNPELAQLVWSDFHLLGKFLAGDLTLELPRDEHPDPDYYEARTGVSLVRSKPVAIDTEGVRGRAWGLSLAQFAGAAVVVKR